MPWIAGDKTQKSGYKINAVIGAVSFNVTDLDRAKKRRAEYSNIHQTMCDFQKRCAESGDYSAAKELKPFVSDLLKEIRGWGAVVSYIQAKEDGDLLSGVGEEISPYVDMGFNELVWGEWI